MVNNPPVNLRGRMTARLAAQLQHRSPELDGLYLSARRANSVGDPDSYFQLELADDRWVLEWTAPLTELDRRASAALQRYAEAVLAASQAELETARAEPLSLLTAAVLLSCPVDVIKGAIAAGTLAAGYAGDSRVVGFTDLLAWGQENPGRIEAGFELDPVFVVD